jgi:hypothetical protein
MKHATNTLALVLALLVISFSAMGQLSGIKTITVDYPNIAAAITDLNLQGVGAGGVTCRVAGPRRFLP